MYLKQVETSNPISNFFSGGNNDSIVDKEVGDCEENWFLTDLNDKHCGE